MIPLIGAAIGAGASILESGANALFQGGANRKARKFAEEMYGRQRADALADWNMQNEYNSPTSQMKRLREAGLNPRLVYGNGTDASNAGPVRSSSAPSWSPEAPRLHLGGVQDAISQYYDIKIKQAQEDNLKAQNTVILQDQLLKAAQTSATGVSTEKTQFDLSQAQRLKDISAEMAEASLKKLKADTDYTLDNNERAAALTANTLQQGAIEVMLKRQQLETNAVQKRMIQQQIENLKSDNTIKQLDIELKRLGIQPGDALWQRMLGRIVGDPTKLQERLKSSFKLPSIDWPGKKHEMKYYSDTTGTAEQLMQMFRNRYQKHK